ncbi:DNA topoisomerase (ATP-hydrolyzing) subunit A [Fusibacter sp. A1]|uniref:DNA gyrase/topoisomerase IV subunit A n=2 Tax=unclassified Fusibacter TaxID=2624464 RepID=UPI001013BEB9|nr:topoisomerase IV [Fusibacter sp. A1]RXV59138.1 topoisomerase IV [Fusibacter sp. A1]
MPYAMSVIVSRAIPEIDGFKPSHRKLLYTMYKMGLLKGNRTKSANVVGQTMKLNPHGDMAIYETLVRLTRGHQALLHPYIDSKGNFGKANSRDMKFAASRYTEVKLDAICKELFADIDKNTVDFVDNYDATIKEPVLLPTTFPNILVSANKGIAVGMASSISSFNLVEVCNMTIAKLQGTDIDPFDYLSGPDFSTGATLLYDEKALRSIYETGGGSVKLRSKYSYDKKNNCLEISEIPYSTTVEAIIDKIVDLIKSGKIKEINDVRDETDLKGLKIALDLKRGTDHEVLIQKLFKLTPLEDNFSCNFNILVNGRPRVMGIVEIVHEWILFRLGCIRRQLEFDLIGLNEKLHLLLGLERVLLDIDQAIKIIRETKDDKAVIPNLMKAFSIDEVQSEFVANIRLRNLNKDYLIKRIEEIVKLKNEIKHNESLLESDVRIKQLMVTQLKRVIEEYGKPRLTEVIHEHEQIDISSEDLIEDYNVKLFLTDHSYFKKITLTSLRASNVHKVKDDDEMVQEIDASNLSDIMFFTDKQNVYKMKAHEFDDHKASELGNYLPNIIDLEPGERVIYMHATTEYDGWFLFNFNNGKLAKVPASSYETKQNRKKLLKAYSDKSPLISMMHIVEDADIAVVRTENDGMKNLLLFSTALVNEKASRSTQGVQVLRLKKDSWMTSAILARDIDLDKPDLYRSATIPVAGVRISPLDNFNHPDL